MIKKFVLSLLLCCSVIQAQQQKIGVFCATDEKIPQEYKDCAFALGESLADAHLALVTGGANTGLMAAVVNGFTSKGSREVYGVIPALFKSYNVHHTNIPEGNLTWTESIYHRMQTFHADCDAMVILPGGFGTLHELMDFIVPKQWGLTNKKIILLNFDNYWDHQLLQFKTMVEKNVLQQKHLDLLTVVTTVESCIEALTNQTISELHTLDTRYWETETLNPHIIPSNP